MLKVSTNADASTSGDKKITKLIIGDINPGSLLVLNGESGTGKSVLCQQLSYNALCNNTCSVAYFTSHNKIDDLSDQMESFSFHVQYHLVSHKLRVYSLNLVNKNPGIDEAKQLLLDSVDSLPSSFTLVVIDSINPLLAQMDAETKIMLLRDIKLLCKNTRRSIIMVTNPHVFSEKNLSRVYAVCDYYLETHMLMTHAPEQVYSKTIRELEIRKISGADMATSETIPFEIRTGTGIHILPYVTVKV